MNDHTNHWNDDSDTVEHYRKTKNLTKQKLERHKKHQNTYCKKSDGNVKKAGAITLRRTTK
jgi:hypothetical protein